MNDQLFNRIKEFRWLLIIHFIILIISFHDSEGQVLPCVPCNVTTNQSFEYPYISPPNASPCGQYRYDVLQVIIVNPANGGSVVGTGFYDPIGSKVIGEIYPTHSGETHIFVVLRGRSGINCNPDVPSQPIFIGAIYKEPTTYSSSVAFLQNSNVGNKVVYGDNANFNWGINTTCFNELTRKLLIDDVVILNYTPTSNSFSYPTNSLSFGPHNFKIKLTNNCGVYYTNIAQIEVVPSCYQDDEANIIANSSITGNLAAIEYENSQIIDYEIFPNEIYTINIAGITDFAVNYHLEFSPELEQISTLPPYTFKVKPGVTIGSFRINIVQNNINSYCPNPPAFKVFLGGRDIVFTEECLITLPDYVFNPSPKIPGVTDPNDILFRHFNFTFVSAQGIIVKPDIILTDGAQLTIIDNSNELDTNDVDKKYNYSENTIYDDYGLVIGSSRIYLDEMGRPTQVQNKSLSDGVIMAAQTLYDKQGRPTVQTLPAPISSVSNISNNTCGLPKQSWELLTYGYKTNFITPSSSPTVPYSDLNFDGLKLGKPDPVDTITPGTLGWYYSDNNISSSSSEFKEPLTDRSQFPFSQVEYYDDGTEEVKTAAGPGDIYRNATSGHMHTSINKTITINEAVLLSPTLSFYLTKWLSMRLLAIPNSPVITLTDIQDGNPLNEVYVKMFTDPHGIKSFLVVDKAGQTLISNYESDPRIVAFNFYDDAGRLRCSVSPNGVSKFISGSSYDDLDKTTYEYDGRGQLSAINEPDAGRTEYKYRRDGQIRFSQDAVQRTASPERFSYTNYDNFARPIESGEFATNNSGIITWANVNSILNNTSVSGGLVIAGGTKSEQVYIFYDGENGTNTAPPNLIQDFVSGTVSCTKKEGVSTTWYQYDERGRLTKEAQYLNGLNRTFTTAYTYGPAENVTLVAYQEGQLDAFYHAYEYDNDIRLTKVYAGSGIITETDCPTCPTDTDFKALPNGNFIALHATYEYYLHGPVKREILGAIADSLQAEDFIYTIDGKLKSFNNPSNITDAGFGDDAYAFSLDYYSGDYSKQGTGIPSLNYGTNNQDYFNGNIKGLSWRHSELDSASSYRYKYNDRYELKSSIYGTPTYDTTNQHSDANSYSEEEIEYDLNGNLTDLRRRSETGVLLHDFKDKYKYDNLGTNQLTSITGYADYAYDPIGRLASADYTSGTDLFMDYTPTDKVKHAYSDSSKTQPQASFEYEEGGMRVMKRNYDGTNDTETWYVRSASGDVMSVYQRVIIGGIESFNQIEIPIQGIARVGNTFRNGTSYKYLYELTDHTGSVRATMLRDKTTSDELDITDWVDYYAYGFVMRKKTPGGSYTYRYGYQGQYAEKDEETGFNAFELRMYDPVIGRWMGPDPYRQFYSSYEGMGNNPISNADSDGGQAQYKSGGGEEPKTGNSFGGWLKENFSDAAMENWGNSLFTPSQKLASDNFEKQAEKIVVPAGKFVAESSPVAVGINLYGAATNGNDVWGNKMDKNDKGFVVVSVLPVGKVLSVTKKVIKGGVKYMKAAEIAKRLGTTVDDFHDNIKPIMKKDFQKEMKSLGTTNPDFTPDDLGNVVVWNPINGKTISTNVPFDLYKK